MKLQYDIINTEVRTIKESKGGEISFEGNYLMVSERFSVKEQKEDDKHIWEDAEVRKIHVIDKSKIFAFRLFFAYTHKKICLEIDAEFHIFFETWSEGKEYFDKIMEWKYPKQ